MKENIIEAMVFTINFTHYFSITIKELPAGKFQLIVDNCMMEDAGEVKFSCGYVETKAKLIVEINEDWRNSLKGGKLLISN